MEVNEEIIEQYLKFVKGWFYISDISFPVPHNYSNIDLLAFDPKTGCYYDIASSQPLRTGHQSDISAPTRQSIYILPQPRQDAGTIHQQQEGTQDSRYHQDNVW
jgi:hypothetical protein